MKLLKSTLMAKEKSNNPKHVPEFLVAISLLGLAALAWLGQPTPTEPHVLADYDRQRDKILLTIDAGPTDYRAVARKLEQLGLADSSLNCAPFLGALARNQTHSGRLTKNQFSAPAACVDGPNAEGLRWP